MMETDALYWGTANGTKHLHSDVKSYGHFAEMEKLKKQADKKRKDFEVLQKKMKLNQQMAMKKKERQGIILKLIESNDNSEERVLQIMKSVKDTGNTTDSAIEQTEAFWKQVAAKNLDAISENMKRKGRVIDLYIVNFTIDPININPENTSTELSCFANYLTEQYSKPLNVPAEPVVAGEPICENEMPKEKNVIDKHTVVQLCSTQERENNSRHMGDENIPSCVAVVLRDIGRQIIKTITGVHSNLQITTYVLNKILKALETMTTEDMNIAMLHYFAGGMIVAKCLVMPNIIDNIETDLKFDIIQNEMRTQTYRATTIS